MPPDQTDQPFAVVTGASSGIGRAIALALAGAGWASLLVGRRLEALRQTADAVGEVGGRAEVLVADLSDPGSPAAIAAAAAATVGVAAAEVADADNATNDDRSSAGPRAVDAVVHSAALFDHAAFADAPADTFRRLLEVNVVAPAELTRLLLPALSRSRLGQVVFVNSTAGQRVTQGLSQYAATKHALKAVADSVRLEHPGLRVLSLYVGRTDTPMQKEYHRREGRPYHAEALIRPESIAAAVLAALSMAPDAAVTDVQVRAGKPM